MNQHRTACNPAQIDQFLNNEIPPAQLADLERHLSVCEKCQSMFDTKLSQIGVASSVAEVLGEWAQYPQATQSMVACQIPPSKMNVQAIIAMAKRMLPKSDNPAMLGRLGEFEILEPLGAGGMGIVFKGYDHELNRYVAVKLLSPSLNMVGAAKQRFLREAQSAASIVSPYVVPIHAVAVEDEIPYLVMSYIPGQNLQEHLDAQGAMSPIETIRIAHQVACGLVAAHERGVIHRDIKPANILLERNVQRALLTDFGLARAADDATLTHSGLLAGTPNYMSPEQSRGDAVDARSDLYSLGCVMYTMLVGHPPFRGANAYAIVKRIAEETPRSVTLVQPLVPAWLEKLVFWLLEKEPEKRISSSHELVAILSQSQLHLEHPATHPIPELLNADSRPSRLLGKTVTAGFIAFFMLSAFAIALRPGTQKTNLVAPNSIAVSNTPSQYEPSDIFDDLLFLPSEWEDEQNLNREVLKLQTKLRQIESIPVPLMETDE